MKIATYKAMSALSLILCNIYPNVPSSSLQETSSLQTLAPLPTTETIPPLDNDPQCNMEEVAKFVHIIEGLADLIYGSMTSVEEHSFATGGVHMAEGIFKLLQLMSQGEPLTAKHLEQVKFILSSLDSTTHRDIFATVWQQVAQRKINRTGQEGLEIIA